MGPGRGAVAVSLLGLLAAAASVSGVAARPTLRPVVTGLAAVSPSATTLTPVMGDQETGGYYLGIGVATNGADISMTSAIAELFSVSPGLALMTMRCWIGIQASASAKNRPMSFSRTTGNTGAQGGLMAFGVRDYGGGSASNLRVQSQNYSTTPITGYTPTINSNGGANYLRVLVLGFGQQHGVTAGTLSFPTFTNWALHSSFNAGGAIAVYTSSNMGDVPSESFALPQGWSLCAAAFDLLPAVY